MTISKAVANWLKEYDMKPVRIDPDQVGYGADSLGIFKSPNREVKEHQDESYQITEYLQLFVVRDSQEVRDREESDEWLENFTYWVDDKRYSGDFPDLDAHRKVLDIWMSGTPYMMEAREDNTSVYQLSLGIKYLREREVEEKW